MNPQHLLCKLISNERISGSTYLMRIEAPSIACSCAPGQFVLLRGITEGWPYLRRAFSIYSSDGESNIEIIYRVVGRATLLMSKMRRGARLDLIGALGRCFGEPGSETTLIGVAGGIGLPPIAYACSYFARASRATVLVVGARTRDELLFPTNLIAEGIEVLALTDDGSKGIKGSALDGLKKVVESNQSKALVVACGPRQMLASIAAYCASRGINCEVSVEQVMGCGIGACRGCAVPSTDGGYLRACKEGPVFDSRQIDWKRWL